MSCLEVMQHPAVSAWMRFNGEGLAPSHVEPLKGATRRRSVFRLHGVGTVGRPVIAKRCYLSTGRVEDFLYRQILPQLPVSAPRYYGYARDDEQLCWLFLEDIGDQRIDHSDPEQQAAVSTWLGRLHANAAVVKPAGLADRGPGHYFNHLDSGRKNILDNLGNPVLSEEDRTVLLAAAKRLDEIAACWDRVAAACEEIPCTLVHGDFRPKNVFVRQEAGGSVIYPLDWEMAGWGVPAPDLAPSRDRYAGSLINLEIYRQIVAAAWPNMDKPQLERMVVIGYLFRRLAAVAWASMSLPYDSTAKAVSLLDTYEKNLAVAIRAGYWSC
ncbi:MAG: aminoglycoside phosphotransferase family protein [Chloroflexota bacterium]|nr:MAG: aminoglycoside phosphotransferase family protein [Chloroflexota bacterium]